jgi:DNA-binding transcriptional regulator YdaS (Cro superfamily)
MNHIQRAIELMGGPAQTAEKLEVSVKLVYFWRDGTRRPGAGVCPTIERLTEGAVLCEQLCPEVDWAQLRGNPLPVPMSTGA